MKTKLNFLVVLILLAVLFGFLAAPAQPAQAATCTVTSAADSGTGTLRARMADSTCSTITFAGDYTIRVSSTLTIDHNMTIDGAGHTIEINGDTNNNGFADSGDTRVFLVNSGVTASLQNLKVARGHCGDCNGGGMYNHGAVKVTNSTFTYNDADMNQGGGIYNDAGTLTILNSTFSNNGVAKGDSSGGGIYNKSGTLTVTNSNFYLNRAENNGGGIVNDGLGATLTVTNSTISDNSTYDSNGGGIYNVNSATALITSSTFSGNSVSFYFGAGGAGIYNTSGGTLTVTNSTFSGNGASGAGGGINSNTATMLTVTNSTFSNNYEKSGGGAIYNSSAATISNNIYVKNGRNCGGNTGGSNNLSDDNSCSVGTTQSSTILLGPLGDYGGGTQTFPLLPGSAAIDAGDDSLCPATDQRGITRPVGAHCDLGAFESQGFTLTPLAGTPQSASVNTGFATPLILIATANGPVEPVNGGQVTYVAPSSGAGATITGSPATIGGSVVSVTAAANGVVGSYNVTASTEGATSANFVLTNTPSVIAVTNANDSGSGSLRKALVDSTPGGTITFSGDYAIHLASELTLDRDVTIDGAGHSVTISGDTTGDGTGDVRVFYINPGVTVNLKYLTITKGRRYCTEYDCIGGGIYNNGTLSMSNVTVSDCYAMLRGGGVYNLGSLTVVNSTFSGNSTSNFGGAIYNYTGMLMVTNSTFSDNIAGLGPAIQSWVSKGVVTITNSTFSGNRRSGSGCTDAYSIYFGHGSATIQNSIFVKGGSTCDPNCYFEDMTLVGTNNLANDASCGGVNATNSASILLGPLGNNGGSTQTHPLLSGSAAIDQGNTAACQDSLLASGSSFIDQRGYNRFADGPDGDSVAQCDIGAFEYGSTAVVQGPVDDTTPPIVFIQQTPENPDGTNGWYRGPVSLQPVAVDDFEVVELRCTLDSPAAPVAYADLPKQRCPFLEGAPVSADGPHTFYAAAMDIHGNRSEVVSAGFQIDATPPLLTCPAAGPFLLNSGDQMVGPAGVDASVAGLDEAASILNGIVTTESVGPKDLTFTAFDLAGNSASQACSYNVIYDFTGFYPPVEQAPTLNAAKAGSAIPLKFSLAGDQGRGILAASYPASQPVACDTLESGGSLEAANPAGQSGLSYDPLTDGYNFVWKTNKDWSGTCRALIIELIDGTQHVAYFEFP